MVCWIVSCVTAGSTAPGVHAGSGRPPTLTQPVTFVRAGATQFGAATTVTGGSILEPVHAIRPSSVRPQRFQPSVKVGVLVDLRQKARPAVVSWRVSPVPFGSAYSHETGSPIAAPSAVFRLAKPETKAGASPGPQCDAG